MMKISSRNVTLTNSLLPTVANGDQCWKLFAVLIFIMINFVLFLKSNFYFEFQRLNKFDRLFSIGFSTTQRYLSTNRLSLVYIGKFILSFVQQ